VDIRLLLFVFLDQELSFAFGDRVHFSCLSKRNRTKEKDTPRSRPLRRFVSRSRGFRQFIPELAKTRVRPARAPSGLFVFNSPLPQGPKSALLLLLPLLAGESRDGAALWSRGSAE